MIVEMIVETPFLATVVRREHCRWDWLTGEGQRYVFDSQWVSDELSMWGINSWWEITDIGDGRWFVHFDGPRHSLHDWLPKGFLEEAHRQWLLGELLDYDSQRDDVSPMAVGLAPEMPNDSWPWDDPQWVPVCDDAPLDDPELRPRSFGVIFKGGAFAQGY